MPRFLVSIIFVGQPSLCRTYANLQEMLAIPLSNLLTLDVIIMTSNVRSSMIDLANNVKDHSYDWIKNLVIQELQKSFKPEFLNRLDEIIVFRKPNKQDLKLITDIMFNEVFERLKVKGIEVHLTKRFEERAINKGFCPSYGARPL